MDAAFKLDPGKGQLTLSGVLNLQQAQIGIDYQRRLNDSMAAFAQAYGGMDNLGTSSSMNWVPDVGAIAGFRWEW